MFDEHYPEKEVLVISKKWITDTIANLEDLKKKASPEDSHAILSQIWLLQAIPVEAYREMDIMQEGCKWTFNQVENAPYHKEVIVYTKHKWNPKYDENAECECGDPYYRHFDTYEKMEAVGCKWCECMEFKPKSAPPLISPEN